MDADAYATHSQLIFTATQCNCLFFISFIYSIFRRNKIRYTMMIRCPNKFVVIVNLSVVNGTTSSKAFDSTRNIGSAN